ncbi:MAG: acetyltransferase [Acidobacteriota bacterium]|nr:acetyltransferase [Acidobacteriota bacterium]
MILVGTSGHASVLADAIEKQNRYEIAGCINSNRTDALTAFGYPILGDETRIPELHKQLGIFGAVIAIGDNWQRARMQDLIRQIAPLRFPAIIHPSAEIARTSSIGEATVVLANAVMNSGAAAGRGCILNTASSLDHDSRLHDFASLAPGAVVGGGTEIGQFSAVCLGARIIHRRRIGEHTVIGAGAVILNDVPDHVVAYGIPGKVVRARLEGERYL